jgi:hypothetical protein
MPASGPMEAFCFPSFQRAAAAVATFELRVRLLADQATEGSKLQRAAISMELTPLIELLCEVHGASIEDQAHLKAIAAIRNKLFHLELSRVTGRIRPLTEQLNEGGNWMLNLTDGSVAQVSKTSTHDGRIYGWMWESTQSGAFLAVVAAAERGAEILAAMRDKQISDDMLAAALSKPDVP